jgi:hypothetical protein
MRRVLKRYRAPGRFQCRVDVQGLALQGHGRPVGAELAELDGAEVEPFGAARHYTYL